VQGCVAQIVRETAPCTRQYEFLTAVKVLAFDRASQRGATLSTPVPLARSSRVECESVVALRVGRCNARR
jgi:hypothetical protein